MLSFELFLCIFVICIISFSYFNIKISKLQFVYVKFIIDFM